MKMVPEPLLVLKIIVNCTSPTTVLTSALSGLPATGHSATASADGAKHMVRRANSYSPRPGLVVQGVSEVVNVQSLTGQGGQILSSLKASVAG